MKKLILIISIFTIVMTLIGCKEEEGKEEEKQIDLVITEYIENDTDNRAVELYNFGSEEINLGLLTLNIYANGGLKVTDSVNLSGKLASKKTYTIAFDSDEMSAELRNKADLVSSNLKFNGDDAISINYNTQVIDILSRIGSRDKFGEDVVLVKKINFIEKQGKYIDYHWIRYNQDNYNYLGNINNSVTEEELLAGPKLVPADYEKPFFDPIDHNLGGGGVIEVTLSSCVDGDTAKFIYPTDMYPENFHGTYIEDETSVRFHNIDTPETMSTLTQEWGMPAKVYTCDILTKAKKIELQSIEKNQIRETYNRVLANVWVDGELLNFFLVQKGMTNVQFSINKLMTYKEINLTNWLNEAANYASFYRKGLNGEVDPYWDYEKNKPR